jgi:hypothetical protein
MTGNEIILERTLTNEPCMSRFMTSASTRDQGNFGTILLLLVDN